jgi:putative phosphoribosyl transferase
VASDGAAGIREHHVGMALRRATAFADRTHAGRLLAPLLVGERSPDAIVVGLARGGVAVAAEVGRALGLPIDALAVRKVGHPWQPEYAIGAVTPAGGVFVRAQDGLTDADVAHAVLAAQQKAEVLDRTLHRARPALPVTDRTVLLVDDGLATGATMVAAVRWARAHRARRVVVAVPVGAADTVRRLEREADAVVAFETPEELGAVGLWYRDFRPVGDAEVLALLAGAASADTRTELRIDAGGATLAGDLAVPASAAGIVVFAHGSGSSRRSARNRLVARALNEAGHATLLFDLLTDEESQDRANVFDVPLLASRLLAATDRVRGEPSGSLPLGYFGASTGAAAALWAASELGREVGAVVSRGGRPDLAAARLSLVTAPTLLLVGGLDDTVLTLNREAASRLRCDHDVVVVPGATHLFEEPGTLEAVAGRAAAWFTRYLGRA